MNIAAILAALAGFLFFLAATPAMAGYAEVCLDNGRTCIDYQATKDCCAAVGGQQHFDEIDHMCKSNNLCGGNSVNIGAMVNCCGSRGKGSREVPYASLCLPETGPPKC